MAMKSKIDLKDVFNDVASLQFVSTVVDLSKGTFTWQPEMDVPVKVDTLEISQDDPTINHYKVIGLDGDWTSSATLGDMTISMTVPTKHGDILKWIYGEDAVKEITNATVTTGDTGVDSAKWTGSSVLLKKKKISGSLGLMNAEENQLMIMAGVGLYATPLYQNTSTEPFAFKLSGTLENAGTQSIAWIKKGAVDSGS